MRSKLYINNNLPAFFVYVIDKKHLNGFSFLDEVPVNDLFLDRLSNQKYTFDLIQDTIRCAEYLGFEKQYIFKRNLSFEKIRNDFFNSFFIVQRKGNNFIKKF